MGTKQVLEYIVETEVLKKIRKWCYSDLTGLFFSNKTNNSVFQQLRFITAIRNLWWSQSELHYNKQNIVVLPSIPNYGYEDNLEIFS